MGSARPSKPDANRKAGGELPYTATEKVLGGPVDQKVEEGLKPEKGYKGKPALPPARK